MSKDFSDKSLPLDKVIELGSIDRWLRGIADIVPKPSDPGHSFSQERDLHSAPGIEVTHLDANMHVMPFASRDLIADKDIECLRGFQCVMTASSKNNVRVDIASENGGALEVVFEPEETFERSTVFGASYHNVLPVMFGVKPMRSKR